MATVYVLPEDDPYHPQNLAALSDEELRGMPPPPLTPGAPLEDCHHANTQAHNLIKAIRDRRVNTANATRTQGVK